ncbi:uncharacterized protein LOC115261247 [Aedes albopictus]|uniref:Uncharacterized protein n=1 Tax=Aedes albopictus TaxID=7160 RepID=A0ABM1XQG8_AEDAL
MDNPSGSAPITEETAEEIIRESSDLANDSLDVVEPSSEPKPESLSDEDNFDDHNYETIDDSPQDLPDGVQYYPPPKPSPTSSVNSLGSQRLTLSSREGHRWNALSRPKCHCLEDTIEQFRKVLDPSKVDNLRRQLHDQKIIREVTEGKHLDCCTRPPTPQPPSGRRQPIDSRQQEQITQKFNARLKRDAFDRLMDKVFTMLPRLVLQADITDMSHLSSSTQQMVNVIISTLNSYAGKPLTIHDHELYLHVAVGLARFFEDVIESVRRKVYSNESISGKEGNKWKGKCSMATATLEKFSEDLDNIQRSREILKLRYSSNASLSKESDDQ